MRIPVFPRQSVDSKNQGQDNRKEKQEIEPNS